MVAGYDLLEDQRQDWARLSYTLRIRGSLGKGIEREVRCWNTLGEEDTMIAFMMMTGAYVWMITALCLWSNEGDINDSAQQDV